ncbi:MAG: alpha/beta hydrolase-fold protein [Acidobacteriota bacterium]
MKRTLLALTVAAMAAAVFAGEPITVGEIVTVESRVLGETRTILVSTPDRYAQRSERYPVLYMTDGNAHLLHTRGTVDFLSRNGLMPDLIVVAVVNTDRTRDLTPTRGSRTLDDGTQQEVANSGGADRFLEFFEKELFPYVEANYRTAPFRLFAGHSLGGLLALHILTAHPGMFDAIIAASPSLRWDDDFILKQALRFSRDTGEARAFLFVTMGDEERDEKSPTRFERLQGILRRATPDRFTWGSRLMTDEDHGTVVLRSHYFGLRAAFDGWRLPSDPRTRAYNGGIADLAAHYAGLSKRFRVAARAPETLVNQLGYQYLGRNEVATALTFFRYNVQLYPESANVHDSLGEALERAGEMTEAAASYSKAVEIGGRAADPNLALFTRNRDRLRSAAATAP